MSSFTKRGYITDVLNNRMFYGEIEIRDGKVYDVTAVNEVVPEDAAYILPGFIDSHVHIESSMLVPSEFARLAVVHGTVGTISDPHEIANVCGIEGVTYMIENGNTVPFKFNFGAPSCVPATVFETAGASLDPQQVDTLLSMPEIKYLSEMMNFPGVLHNDPEVMQKIAAAKKYNKPVDGHAPGLRGKDAQQYINAGISTDHECFTAEEALDKLSYGMKILIREGSAAKNFEALAPLLNEHYEQMMLCSDDKHPDSLAAGHINKLCARAVAMGIDVMKVLRAACVNPVLHYKMDVGLLQKGDHADLIILKDLKDFYVTDTYINGEHVASNGKTMIAASGVFPINHFDCTEVIPDDFIISASDKPVQIIEAIDGQLITNAIQKVMQPLNGNFQADLTADILKIAVVNRYNTAPVAKGFIKNFGITSGAIASSVAHDSHNIVVVGTDDKAIAAAVNAVIRQQGGISALRGQQEHILALPIAGLMSDKDGYEVAKAYTKIDRFVKEEMGSTLSAPFMTLSFMALLVIPHLKISDKGLFNGDTFSFIN